MVIKLYMMQISSPCRAVLMTIRHIGIQVELLEENLVIGNQRIRSDFIKMNPRSCVPTIDDNGFYLWESRAIMTYLVNKYAPCDPLYPRDPERRALVDMMLSFDQGTLYRAQVEYLYPQVFRGEPPNLDKELCYQRSLVTLDDTLALSSYAAGNHVTLADLSLLANIALAEVYNYDFSPYLNISRWLKKLKETLHYYKEVNEIPLLQFKFCYQPCLDSDGENDMDTTRL